MGIVYRAHEESLNRFVAIKVLGEHLTEDSGHVERFLREARSAASLNHPNIVQIYAVSEEDGRHFFAMEYVSGRSLQQIMRSSGPLDPIQVARIALQTASGLSAAHEQGIIHRDIKPANLMIDDRGLVKIADFGLALVAGGVSRLTATGMFMGTPGYLSPEQCLDQNPDHRTDIYSLGVTVYEALSGKVPFTADSPLALLRQIVEVEPPDLGELKPNLDPELRAIVVGMMAKDREQRISSCAELIDDLETFLEHQGASGTLVERVAASAGSTPSPPKPEAAAELDSQPTRQVSSDAIAAGATAVTTPAVRTEAPVVETSPLDEPPSGSGRRLALVAVLVVLFGFLAIVVAGVLAWKSGLFQTALGGGNSAVSEIGTTISQEAMVSDETTHGEATPDEVEEVTPAGDETSESGAVEQMGDRETSSGSVGKDRAEPPTIDDHGTQADTAMNESRTDPKNQLAGPPPSLPPPPEGTVVIAVGETVLAGEAEAVVEDVFARAGVKLVDENGIPGIAAFIGTDLAPEPGEVHHLLRPHAAHLVLVRVEYLGERPLVYMGQRDVAFQARIVMVPIDLQAGNALAQPVRLRTEYTHLNAQRVAEKELSRPAYRFSQLLLGR
jgi:serine/threonine-protein kinase